MFCYLTPRAMGKSGDFVQRKESLQVVVNGERSLCAHRGSKSFDLVHMADSSGLVT